MAVERVLLELRIHLYTAAYGAASEACIERTTPDQKPTIVLIDRVERGNDGKAVASIQLLIRLLIQLLK